MSAERIRQTLPVLAAMIAALLMPGLPRGPLYSYYMAAQRLVEDHSPWLDGALAGSRAADGSGLAHIGYFDGHYHLAMSPLVVWLVAPLYGVGTLVARLQPGAGWAPLITSLIIPVVILTLLAGIASLTRRHGLGQAQSAFVLLVATAAILPLATLPTLTLDWLAAATALVWIEVARTRRSIGWAAGQGVLLGLVTVLVPWLGLAGLVILWPDRGPVIPRGLGLSVPAGIAGLLQLAIFGRPWRFPQQFAIEPMVTHDLTTATALLLGGILLGAIGLGVARHLRGSLALLAGATAVVMGHGPIEMRLLALFPAALLGWFVLAAYLRRERWLQQASLGVSTMLGLAGVVLSTGQVRDATDLLLHYTPLQRVLGASLIALLGVALIAPWATRRLAMGSAVALMVVALVVVGAPGASASAPAVSMLPPFEARLSSGEVRPLWRVAEGASIADGAALLPDATSYVVSQRVDVRPGQAVCAEASGAGTIVFVWEDDGHRVVLETGGDGTRDRCFAAPLSASWVRLRVHGGRAASISSARLWSPDPTVNLLPSTSRAALAFTFDWESAMGGLIHSRGGAPGSETEPGEARSRGAVDPLSVAIDRGLRMRRGAEILQSLFAQHEIHGTFYATGYNLLTGNTERRTFAGDPTYDWAGAKDGWASDYWLTHPWYSADPYGTEATHPAWYFGALTRSLAAAGHEIESHTFGHLYVRGTTPDELETDLREWNQAAVALGLPPASSFAFPWTSSNSVREPHYQRMADIGITSVTRMYRLRPDAEFELDAVENVPAIMIFPDHYMPSTPEGAATGRDLIDELLARGGYQSLWTHPEEVVDDEQVAAWRTVIDYSAAARARGLWVAPLGEIVSRVRAARKVNLVALRDGGTTVLWVENPTRQDMTELGLAQIDGLAVPMSAEVRQAERGMVVIEHLPAGAVVRLDVRHQPDGA